MVVEIDFASSEPIYQQIVSQVIRGIADGALKSGDALPSVRQLAVDLGINLHTVHKAYDVLRQQGYVLIHRRRGALISAPARQDAAFIDTLEHGVRGFADRARSRGMDEETFLALCRRAYNEPPEAASDQEV
nr:GntR family transcriptional regulator [Maliibacterium massiliense]